MTFTTAMMLAAQKVVTDALEQDECPVKRDIAYPGYGYTDGWRLAYAVENDVEMLMGIVDPKTWENRITEVR